MTKSAAVTMREIAERRVAAFLREAQINDENLARDLVALVFRLIADPDHFMQEAGRRELELAVPNKPGPVYVRNLAGAVWRTMVAEARR